MVVDSVILVDDFYVNDVVLFLDSQVVQFLIKCGVNVNVQDNGGNIFMYVFVNISLKINVNLKEVENVIYVLVDVDFYLDICNKERKIIMDCVKREEEAILLRIFF